MNALIIEDSQKSRVLLKTLLREHCLNITEVFQAGNLKDGISIIKTNTVDILFLDIEMPEYSGLQILEFLKPEDINFEIIFTTAYSQYAIRAFELSAIDYLLKPLRPKQLKKAVEKAEEKLSHKDMSLRLKELKKTFLSEKFKKIPVPTGDGVQFINYEDVLYVEADSMYAKFHLVKRSEPVLVSRPLSFFEQKLTADDMFYKPHRSYIVNLQYITAYVKKGGPYLVLNDKYHIPVSRERKSEILSVIENLG